MGVVVAGDTLVIAEKNPTMENLYIWKGEVASASVPISGIWFPATSHHDLSISSKLLTMTELERMTCDRRTPLQSTVTRQLTTNNEALEP